MLVSALSNKCLIGIASGTFEWKILVLLVIQSPGTTLLFVNYCSAPKECILAQRSKMHYSKSVGTTNDNNPKTLLMFLVGSCRVLEGSYEVPVEYKFH